MTSKTYNYADMGMRALRLNSGLSATDGSKDEELKALPPHKALSIIGGSLPITDATIDWSFHWIRNLGGRIVWPEDEVQAETKQTPDPDEMTEEEWVEYYAPDPVQCDGCSEWIPYTENYLSPHDPDCPNWRPTGNEDGKGFVDCECNRVFHVGCYDIDKDMDVQAQQYTESIREYTSADNAAWQEFRDIVGKGLRGEAL